MWRHMKTKNAYSTLVTHVVHFPFLFNVNRNIRVLWMQSGTFCMINWTKLLRAEQKLCCQNCQLVMWPHSTLQTGQSDNTAVNISPKLVMNPFSWISKQAINLQYSKIWGMAGSQSSFFFLPCVLYLCMQYSVHVSVPHNLTRLCILTVGTCTLKALLLSGLAF